MSMSYVSAQVVIAYMIHFLLICREPGLWDLVSGSHLYNLPVHTAGVQSTAIIDSGKLAITGSTNPSLAIWDILSPPISHTTRVHVDDITSVVLSGCGGLGVCMSQKGSVSVFDADTMTVIQQFQPHTAAISQVLLYKDCNKLFSSSADGTVCLWNGETGEIIAKFEEQESPVNCLAITSTKDLLMSGAENGEVTFWNIDKRKKLRSFADHTSGVLVVAFVTQNKDKFMLSSSRDGNLCIREFHTAKVVISTQLNTGALVSTAIAPNAKFIVCGSKEGSSYVVSLPYGTLMSTLTGHSTTVSTVKVFSDSTKCVTGSTDRTIRVWSIKDGQCMAVLFVDAPVLACDVNCNMIILYGMEGGWVSTAAFQSDPSKPNALISQLNARDSPTVMSSSVSSSTPLESGVEVLENDDSHDGIEEATDEGENHSPQLNNETDETKTVLHTEPEAVAINGTLSHGETKVVLYEHTQNGRIAHKPSIDAIVTLKSTMMGAEDASTTTSKESTSQRAGANSSTCILL